MDLQERLERLVTFLQQHSFLYDFINNRFLADRHWERIPHDWITYMATLSYAELNELPALDETSVQNCPDSLKEFFATSSELSILQDNQDHVVATTSQAGIGAKKKHELEAFVPVIRRECARLAITRIVDIGCGLGHLLGALNDGIVELVGIESQTSLGHKGQRKYDGVRIVQMELSDDTPIDDLQAVLSSENHRTAIVSLHGCGDLQCVILRAFSSLSKNANPLLLTVGCCYHKAAGTNFPMSNALRTLSTRMDFTLPVTGFRLACQETMARWRTFTPKEHEDHKQAFASRAILEVLFGEEGLEFPSCRRLRRSLGSTLDDVRKRLLDLSRNGDSVRLCDAFDNALEQYVDVLEYIEPFTALQFAIQGSLESLILLDRQTYLLENGRKASLQPIFSSAISPRNMCMLAE